MKLVQQILINKKHEFFEECDKLAFLSKNLYNYSLYRIKQVFENESRYLNYYELYSLLIKEKQKDFYALPTKVSQQILIQLDINCKSFFKALQEYKKNPNKFTGKPIFPKFKHKEKGRFIVPYDLQAISGKKLKDNIIQLSKTNISLKTQLKNIKRVTITPYYENYKINIIYEKQEELITENENYAGIDLGLNNLSAVVYNNCDSFLINGKPLKSINQYYNKKLAYYKSKLPHIYNKEGDKIQIKSSKKTKSLTQKRNNKIKDYLHKASNKVVNKLKQDSISKVVIGYNKQWKNEINIGKKNNQNFVSIPHLTFLKYLEYKCKLKGIEVIIREESYTSKCSALDLETVRKHNEYKGKRIKRGLFKSSKGILINADINGAFNILRKEFPNCLTNGIEGLTVSPLIISL